MDNRHCSIGAIEGPLLYRYGSDHLRWGGGVEKFEAARIGCFARVFDETNVPAPFSPQMTIGATEALFVSLKALVGPGDEVRRHPSLEPLFGEKTFFLSFGLCAVLGQL